MPAFDWLRSVSPESHFPYEKQMKRKSKVLPLPILDKNENKLEECIDILDMYEDTLHEAYDRAFGNIYYAKQVLQQLETYISSSILVKKMKLIYI